MKEGERRVLDVQALVGTQSEAFVNFNFTTPKGCVTTVDISVYRYVVPLRICLATVDFMMYRFPKPYHDKVELKVSSGDGEYDLSNEVSVFRLCSCCHCN